MIIDSTSSNKITIGQTTEYKTTIDIENLDFIATLLSSNLYSNPEESFIREIVSNGWDSHVEANNTKTPIIVRTKQNCNYNYDITIRDYGTGLSKEDFENLYCKIGSSTKRQSNNYLGCFGLGHLSPLSVSKVCYITSYYDGIARFYVMTKDGNNITTNLMSEMPTDEHNGLEIVVKNQMLSKYENAFKDLMFFPNVYIDGSYSWLNETQIKRFKYFSSSSAFVDKKILLGNVLYPLQIGIIPSDLKDFYHKFYDSGLVLNFNIGELTVTPNRESIIYNTKTNELIIQRIRQARQEIADIINPHISKDFTNPYTYYNLIYGGASFDFISNELRTSWGKRNSFKFNGSIIPYTATLNGRIISNADLTTVRRCEFIIPKHRGTIVNDRVYTSEKQPYECTRVIRNPERTVLIIPSSQKLTCYIKSWLTFTNTTAVICDENTYTDYMQAYLKHYQKPTNEEEFVIKSCYDYLKSKFKVLDLENDAEFLEYKENLRKEKKENRTVNVKDVILTVSSTQVCWGRPTKRRFTTYADALKFIKNLKGGTLYRNLDAMQIASVANKLGYNVIGANKTILKLLEEEDFTSRITEETLLNNSKIIKLKTLKESGLEKYIYNMSSYFISTLPIDIRNEIKNTERLSERTYDVTYYISQNLDKIPTDENLFNMYKMIAKCYEDYINLLDELNIEGIQSSMNEIVSYIIMKNKLYKIGYDCYKQIKNNKIISRLCKK